METTLEMPIVVGSAFALLMLFIFFGMMASDHSDIPDYYGD